MEKALHFHTCVFIGLCCLLTQVISTPVDIGIFFRVIALQGLNHHLRLLAGGGIIQVDQRLAVHLSLKNREVLPNAPDIEWAVPYRPAVRSKQLRGTLHHASFTLWL